MSNVSSEPTTKKLTKAHSYFFRDWVAKKPTRFRKTISLVSLIIIAFLVFVSSQTIAFIIVRISSNLNGLEDSLKSLEDSTPTQFFYVLLAEMLAVVLVFGVCKWHGLTLKLIGLGRLPKFGDAGRAILGVGAFYALLIIAGLLLNFIVPDFKTDQPQDIGFNNLNSMIDYILAFVALVILAPLAEEVLIRGYLYSGLRTYLKFIPAMVLTSLLFALPHLQPWSGKQLVWGAALNTFVLSLVLVYLREKTQALYAGMIVHSLNNLVAFAVLFRGVMI